jgi:hypothetical protein
MGSQGGYDVRKSAVILLAIVGIFGFAATSLAQSPIGLYGRWSSARSPGSGGEIQLTDIAASDDGAFVGRAFFTGSPRAVWANFSGRLYGDTASLSMVVGPCGLSEVTLQRQGAGWVGTYRS